MPASSARCGWHRSPAPGPNSSHRRWPTCARSSPACEVHLQSALPEEGLALLRRGLVDVAVIETHEPPAPDDGLAYHRLLTDPFRLVLPRGHRFARQRSVALADTRDEAWINLRNHIGCCRHAKDAAFARAGFAPTYIADADEFWPAQGFVAAGLGLALIPALALGVIRSDVVARPLRRDNEVTRDVYAVTRAALSATTAVQAILAALTAASRRQPQPALT